MNATAARQARDTAYLRADPAESMSELTGLPALV
jgi:hypothetical protein